MNKLDRVEEKDARGALTQIMFNKHMSHDLKIDQIMALMNAFVGKYKMIGRFDAIDDEKSMNMSRLGSCCNMCFLPCRFFIKTIKLTFLLMFLILALTGAIYIVYYVITRI